MLSRRLASAIQRSLSCVKILLGSGADPTITPDRSSVSPLILSFGRYHGGLVDGSMTVSVPRQIIINTISQYLAF